MQETSNRPPSHWVEFYGGPYDGLMDEMPWAFIPGTENMGVAVSGPDVPLEGNRFRLGAREGVYRPAYWLDEDLGIIRMDWRPGTSQR